MREQEKGEYNPEVVRRVLRYVRPHARYIALAFVMMLLGTGMMLSGPYLTKVAIDTNIAQGDMPGLVRTVLMLLLTLVLSAVGIGAQFYLVFTTGTKTLAALRADTFAKLQHLSLSYFDQQEVGDVMSRVMNDVDTLNQLLTHGLAIALSDILHQPLCQAGTDSISPHTPQDRCCHCRPAGEHLRRARRPVVRPRAGECGPLRYAQP